MRRLSTFIGCAFAVLISAVAFAQDADEESRVISLDEIWAYEMPNTRTLKELAKAIDMRLMALVLELSYERAERLEFKNVARPGFAVSGSGRSALHAALAVLIDSKARRQEFSANEEITLVFFSEPISRYRVQIRKVSLKDNRVEIQYELQKDIGGTNFTNFALMPLGQLPVGEYRVEMRQVARDLQLAEIKMGFKPLDNEWANNFLCKPFEFAVSQKNK
jgi:hypothetical protein